MQHDDLDREKAICDQATAGYWEARVHNYETPGGYRVGFEFDTPEAAQQAADKAAAADGDKTASGYAEFRLCDDRAFWQARTAWPARIEECRRLRAEIERLKAAGALLAEQVRIDLSQPAIVVALDADVVAELERACEAFGKGN